MAGGHQDVGEISSPSYTTSTASASSHAEASRQYDEMRLKLRASGQMTGSMIPNPSCPLRFEGEAAGAAAAAAAEEGTKKAGAAAAAAAAAASRDVKGGGYRIRAAPSIQRLEDDPACSWSVLDHYVPMEQSNAISFHDAMAGPCTIHFSARRKALFAWIEMDWVVSMTKSHYKTA